MNAPEILDLGNDAIWVMIKMCAPIMLIGLVVGVIVALFQALTQIQEMTLVFVPKILAIFIGMIFFMSYMGNTLNAYVIVLFDRIANGQMV